MNIRCNLYGQKSKRKLVAHLCGGVRELSVFCQSYFNKTLIDQEGSIGGKTRQEVEVMQ